jgi:DNA gyrase subunit A
VLSEKATPKATRLLAVSKGGYGLQFNVDPHRELSTRSGRRFAKPAEGDEIVGVLPVGKKDVLAVVTVKAHALICPAAEISELAGPGRGVTVIKVGEDDAVIGFGIGDEDADTIVIAETEGGKEREVGPGHDEVVSRGGKGRQIAKKTTIVRVRPADDGTQSSGTPKLLN